MCAVPEQSADPGVLLDQDPALDDKKPSKGHFSRSCRGLRQNTVIVSLVGLTYQTCPLIYTSFISHCGESTFTYGPPPIKKISLSLK